MEESRLEEWADKKSYRKSELAHSNSMIHVNYWQGRSPPLTVHCNSIPVTRGCSPPELAPAFDANVKYIPRPLYLCWGTGLKLHGTAKQEAAAFKNRRVGDGRQGGTGILGNTGVGCKVHKLVLIHSLLVQPFTDWLTHHFPVHTAPATQQDDMGSFSFTSLGAFLLCNHDSTRLTQGNGGCVTDGPAQFLNDNLWLNSQESAHTRTHIQYICRVAWQGAA